MRANRRYGCVPARPGSRLVVVPLATGSVVARSRLDSVWVCCNGPLDQLALDEVRHALLLSRPPSGLRALFDVDMHQFAGPGVSIRRTTRPGYSARAPR